MKPRDLLRHPYNSVLQSYQAEVVARNIMVILSKTDNEFHSISWNEYKKWRLQDGNFTELERDYFNKVIPYFASEDTVKLFSHEWGQS